MHRRKNIVNIIIAIMLLICSCFGLCSCLDGGTTGGGSSGSSGGSSEGGSGEGNKKIEITSSNEDDFFSGVMIMYDAGYSGEFYDTPTESKKKFTDLLDRQITTFTSHLLTALNIVYGDDSVYKSVESSYDILATNADLKAMWGDSRTIQVNPTTILSFEKQSGTYMVNTQNYDLPGVKETLAKNLSGVAELGTDNKSATNPFYFNNAIKGGYVYKITNEETGEGEFTNELNVGYKWSMDISASVDSQTIRDAIANIIANKSYTELTDNYEDCLQKIEYLGFSKNDLSNIAQYVLTTVIGSAYNTDEAIRSSIPTDSYINSNNKFTNLSSYYYKAYQFVTKILVGRMADMTITGLYYSDSNFIPDQDEDKILAYTVAPRTNIEIMKCSELFSRTSDIEIGDDGTLIGGGEEAKAILENIKIKQIVFLPKLSEDVKADYVKKLKEAYGNSYSQHADYRFQVKSMGLALKTTSTNELSKFVFLPTFTIMAEGEVVHQDKIENESARLSKDYLTNDSYYDDYALNIDYVYDANQDSASYNVGDAMGDSKFADYNGVAVFDESGTPSADYFFKDGDKYYLKSDRIANMLDNNAVYLASYDEDGEFIFTFNGGDNFLQADFNYFPEDVTDLYQNANIKKIVAQATDIMSLSIFI